MRFKRRSRWVPKGDPNEGTAFCTEPDHTASSINVLFQEVAMPTPGKVIRDSLGERRAC